MKKIKKYLVILLLINFISIYNIECNSYCEFKFGFIVKPTNEYNLFFVELDDVLLKQGSIDIDSLSNSYIKNVYVIYNQEIEEKIYPNLKIILNKHSDVCNYFTFALVKYENFKNSMHLSLNESNFTFFHKDTVYDNIKKVTKIRINYELKLSNKIMVIKNDHKQIIVNDFISIDSYNLIPYLCETSK